MPSVMFDDVAGGTCQVFEAPVACIRAQTADEVGEALRQLQERIDAGFHLAGYFGYELGYLLEPRLARRLPPERATPLLWFGVFDHPPRELGGNTLERDLAAHRAYAGPLALEWDVDVYAAKFAAVAGSIARGDLYQANLSLRGEFTLVGDPRGLYRDLRRSGGGAYSAYIDDGARKILSFSPELFFELDADGTITCRPMKGTAPRTLGHPHSADATCRNPDAEARASLRASTKNRAENLMIVDLVRNDLGRVAITGSVDATRLFEIESYPTVHQMVSTVSARLKPGTGVRQLLEALFPSGSVTGAPKIRAMQAIREQETSPRGIYCGAIGWFAPDRSARFNVAIRTLTIAGNRGELGIGGGVVADSCAADEYAECRLKARYFEAARRPLKLIETLRCEAGRYVRLELHLRRLEASARAFGIPFDRDRVLAALHGTAAQAAPQTLTSLTKAQFNATALRVRLTLDEQGQIEVHAGELAPTSTAWRYAISNQPLDSTDLLLRHKTDWRELHGTERDRAVRQSGCDEVLFRNERGELCEGSRSNVFLAIGGELLTPAASSGLLPGCLRQELLATGHCREAVLTPADLDAADQVYFGNSLRGLVPACIAD